MRTSGRSWTLVGRRSELSDLVQAVGSGAGAFVAGAMGVGKSRLLGAVADDLAGRDHDVITVAGVSAAGDIPLGPLLPVLRENADATDPGRRILAELYRRARHRPVVIIADDAHLLDHASASVIHQVAQTGLAPVVVAVRTPEQQPGGIEALWRDQLLERMDLGPLDGADVARLVTDTLGDAVDPDTLDRFWELTGGYPLYLRESIEGALEAGTLQRDISGTWRLAAASQVPDRLVDIVRSRLGRLDPTERAALELVSLAPRSTLEAIGSLSSAAAVDELERRGIVVLRADKSHYLVEPAHPVFAEVALSRLGPHDLNRRRRDLGKLLAEEGTHPAQAASLLLDAGAGPGPELLMRAIRHAAANVDASLLERLAAAAADATGATEARLALADAFAKQHRWTDADQQFEIALNGAGPSERREILLRWLSARSNYSTGPDAVELGQRLLAIDTDDPDTLEVVLRLRVFTQPAQMELVSSELRSLLARPGLSPACRSRSEMVLATSLHWTGHHSAALATLHQSDGTDLDRLDAGRGSVIRIWATGWSGRVTEAAEMARRWSAEMSAGDDADVLSLALAVQGGVEMLTGRIAEATELFAESSRLLAVCSDVRSGPVTLCLLAMGIMEVESATPDDQAAALAAVEALPDDAVALPESMVAVSRSRFERLSGSGDGVEPLRKALARFDGTTATIFDAHALFELVAVGRADLAITALSAMNDATDCDGHIAWWARAARATLAADGHALIELAHHVTDRGATGVGADLALLANGAFAATDRPADAVGAARLSQTLRDSLPGTRSMVAATAVTALSDRERQICGLVLDGRTNRQIADDLYVSVRTVEGHLHRSYAKLHLDGRHGLLRLDRTGASIS